ncbi:MAG TPA: glycosyltransferase [Syntrophomonas sp.]|nr:glycosyltransferase [Syntrophomonas sp.]
MSNASNVLVSLCMIVKDEEGWLGRCLDSVASIADEIIVVDTGSTDGTKAVGREHKAKVYDFEWTESFSAARNFGLEKATGKWVMWLDADEELELEDAGVFKRILAESKSDLWMIPLINYYGGFPPDSNRAYLYAGARLFRNHKDYRFTGRIHEHLDVRQILDYSAPKVMPGAKIHHYGYMDQLVESKNKNARNLSMLLKETENPEYDPWIDYHIASEYYRAREFPQAFERINMSIRRFLGQKSMPPSLLYKLKYDILITAGDFDGGWPGIEKAIALYPEYVDLHFYKGIILYNQQKYEEAMAAFRHCLELGETRLQYLTLAGCGGYLAWYFIGRCLEDMKKFVDSGQAYIQAIGLNPQYQEAWLRLRDISS